VWAGYTIGLLVALRIVWGFVGPGHARFSDFLYGPVKTWAYLVDLAGHRAQRYLGHSPAGAAMVFALLIGLAVTVFSGLELYAVKEHAGPLAAFSGETVQTTDQLSTSVGEDEENKSGENGKGEGAGEFWKELHEVLANTMMVLAILHIGGVLLASVVHRENLARTMITGRKRAR
jgi:cytochrome b